MPAVCVSGTALRTALCHVPGTDMCPAASVVGGWECCWRQRMLPARLPNDQSGVWQGPWKGPTVLEQD